MEKVSHSVYEDLEEDITGHVRRNEKLVKCIEQEEGHSKEEIVTAQSGWILGIWYHC